MKRDRDRAEKLIDIGSTTAISSLVEIVSNGSAAGVMVRQFNAMLDRIRDREEQGFLIEGFLGEVETFVESVPGARLARKDEPERKRRAA